MSNKDIIAHKGEIVEMTPDFTTVKIISHSACSSCHAKGLCGMADEQEKLLQLPTDPYATYSVGDVVDVKTKKSMGLKAVWISYVIPLAILMILILSLSLIFENELYRGLFALLGVGVYYFIIWLFRDKLNNEFVFFIE